MWTRLLRNLLSTVSVWLLNKYRQTSLELIKLELAIGYVKGVRSARQAFLAMLVVILGAGYDSRAYRFRKIFPDLKFLEVDLPATQAQKEGTFNGNIRFPTRLGGLRPDRFQYPAP